MEIRKITYNSPEERQFILLEQTDAGNVLIEEQNIIEGAFLIFQDLSKDRYIAELEDQILLMADAANGGIL